MIHQYLSQDSYWAKNIPLAVVENSIQNSLNFGVFTAEKQVGFARVITDCATFAYVCDVFILPGFRGKGLSKWLMQCIISYPALQGIRRFMLMTQDAHDLYSQLGFSALKYPDYCMEIAKLGIYTNQ